MQARNRHGAMWLPAQMPRSLPLGVALFYELLHGPAQIRRSLDSFVVEAVQIAMIADPPTGDALVRVWDEVCDSDERGLLAWSLCAATCSAHRYGEKLAKKHNRAKATSQRRACLATED
jgi:hypothetical protein